MSMTSRPSQTQSRSGLWRRIAALFSRSDKASRSSPSQVSGGRRGLRAFVPARRTLPIGAALLGVALVGVVASRLLLPESETLPRNNAIWLDRAWTFGDLEADQLNAAVAEMGANGIGKIYAYVSTLGLTGRWEGGMDGGSFMDFAKRYFGLRRGPAQRGRVIGCLCLGGDMDARQYGGWLSTG